MNRLDAGFCLVRNPVSDVPFRVSLQPHDIGGIVFWTKNPEPMMSRFTAIKRLRIPFYVQFTITPYGPPIEMFTPSVSDRIETALRLADAFGPDFVVWRYDPVLISEGTPAEWHIDQFCSIAERLSGIVDEVAISFVVPYQKTIRNLSPVLGSWIDSTLTTKPSLARELHAIASAHGISLKVCSQPEIAGGILQATCADPARFARLGVKLPDIRRTPTRHGCNCLDSRDIGEYDTCVHGCVYCYATTNADKARRRYGLHNPHGECLIPLLSSSQSVVPQTSLFE